MNRELMGKIVDEVFDGAIEDASVIEEIYAVIKREEEVETAQSDDLDNRPRYSARRMRDEVGKIRAERDAAYEKITAAREFVTRHPGLTLVDQAEFEAFLKVPATIKAAIPAPVEKYRNSIDGKTYELISESEGLVTFKREGRDTLIHLGSAEFYKRYQAMPIPAPASNGGE